MFRTPERDQQASPGEDQRQPKAEADRRSENKCDRCILGLLFCLSNCY